MIDIITAIVALDSTTQVSVHGDEIIWHDGNPNEITAEQITAKQTELQTAYDAKAYARTRATAYPADADFKEAYTEKEIGGDLITYNKVRTDNPK